MVNKSVKILTGKYAGLAGVVEKMGENGSVKVHIEGVANDEPVNATVWLKAAQWEAL
jgi:transcription antitermination factor NusG